MITSMPNSTNWGGGGQSHKVWSWLEIILFFFKDISIIETFLGIILTADPGVMYFRM